jgi:uncharacterized protein (DUF58 family)
LHRIIVVDVNENIEENCDMDKKIMRAGISIIWLVAGVFSYIRGNYVFLALSAVMFCLFLYNTETSKFTLIETGLN